MKISELKMNRRREVEKRVQVVHSRESNIIRSRSD